MCAVRAATTTRIVVPSPDMARDLVALYEDVLRRCQRALGLPDAASTRSRLYSLLQQKPIDPRIAGVLAEMQLSASYVRTHLLSIGSWPDAVTRAMRAGLPYQDARRIAQLDDAAQREVLSSFRASSQARQHTNQARAVERRLRHDRLAKQITRTVDGWVAPTSKPGAAVRELRSAYVYTAFDVAIGFEALPLGAVESLVRTYAPEGGSVVDPMAGAGTTAIAARGTGRWVWSGDVEPRYPFIHGLDATDAASVMDAISVRTTEADLVVLHPPSYPTWLTGGQRRTVAAYLAWIDLLVASAARFTRAGGHIAVVVHPSRTDSEARLFTDVVGAMLRESVGARLVGYHVLVEARGDTDWHVLVGKVGT